VVLSSTRNVALALVAFLAFGWAQDKPQKMAKDQAEADLINSIPKAPNPAEQLKLLDKWTHDYPQTDFAAERTQQYLITYQALNRPADAFKTALEILKTNPNDFGALRGALGSIYAINNGNPPAADLDEAEKVCNHMLTDLDTIFAADKVPAGMNADQWAQVKPAMKVFTQRTVGWIYMTRKDNGRAETEFIKALQLDPSQAQTSYWLATVLFAQRAAKPEKQPPSIFEFARAATYDGPNSLPADFRKQLQASVAKTYASYHGSNEGFDQLLALAKTNALPPSDFTIKDVATIAREKAEEQAKIDAANPMLALWRTIKTGLTGDNPDAFFEGNVKGTGLPGGVNGVMKFKGKIISMTPELRPKTLVLAVEKPDVADVTLTITDGPLPGKMDPGSELEFSGAASAYKKDPYMLVLDVEKADITGWTGKNPPAAKKAAPKKAAKQ
jgi:tetratricopeptide (TPR) repeat protein